MQFQMKNNFKKAAQEIIKAGNRMDHLNLALATSGNYSIRLEDNTMAITVSGAHKGKLKESDIMCTDLRGLPLESKKPSSETLLHCLIYDLYPETNAILHTHSVACNVLTRSIEGDGEIFLSDYEMLKAYRGIHTHEVTVSLPVFKNMQDMVVLSEKAISVLNKNKLPAFLIRCHGIYGWGSDMDEAIRVVEATEMLLLCEMHQKKVK